MRTKSYSVSAKSCRGGRVRIKGPEGFVTYVSEDDWLEDAAGCVRRVIRENFWVGGIVSVKSDRGTSWPDLNFVVVATV